MNRWCRIVVLLILTLAADSSATAQKSGRKAKPTPTVLFVCEHGTVRSLLAKVLFEQYAADAGLKMRAVSRGTRADSTVPGWMQQGLAGDHIELGSWRPQTLEPADLAKAAYVVTFDVPPESTALAHAPQARWDGLPSVSKDYAGGRDAIKVRVRALVDSLKRSSTRLK